MAITDTQKVDYLWKKIGYGRVKTDVNSIKNATNESISSPLLLRGEEVWAESYQIPSTIPSSSTNEVTVYLTSNPVECTADITSSTNRTWKSGTVDWIPPEIGSTYLIKAYLHTSGDAANAATSGTQVFGAGSGNNDEWFFDYKSGVLNFIGTNLPSGISGKSVYISGAVYTGIKGVPVPGAAVSFTNVSATGIATFLAGLESNDIQIGVTAANEIDTLTSNLILDSATGQTVIDDDLRVTGVSTFVGNVTFEGGIINLGDSDTDNIVVGGEFASDLSPDVDATYNLGSASKRWRSLSLSGSADVGGVNNSGVTTTTSLKGFSYLQAPHSASTQNYSVTVVSKTAAHRYNGTGSGSCYAIDGVESPILHLTPGKTYRFTLSSGDMSAHPFRFYLDADKTHAYTNDVTVTATYTEIVITDSTPKVIHYQCSAHGYMGNAFITHSNAIDTPYAANFEETISVAGIATFTSNVDLNADLDVDGYTELDEVNVSETLSVTGIATFTSDVDLNADLDVDGYTELDEVNVSQTLSVAGIATFTSAVDLNSNLDVDGYTELDEVNVSETLSVTGIATFTSAVDLNSDLDVDGYTQLDEVNVSQTLSVAGIATFSSNVDLTGDLDLDGGAAIDNVQIGVSGDNEIDTSSGDLTLDSDGGTVIVDDGLSVVGVTTFNALVDANAAAHINDLRLGTSANNEIETSAGNLVLDSATGMVYVDDDLTVAGSLFVQGSTTQVDTNSITVEDRTIELGIVNGVAPASATTWDLGVLFNYNDGSAKKAAVAWESSVSRFIFGSQVADGGGTGNSNPQLTYTAYAPVEIAALWVNDCAGQSQVISCTGTERHLENITIDAGSF
tara:strand:- start:6816 stop:9356 length:2541 start_codon:yes stop_codon:yes gene_type:complete